MLDDEALADAIIEAIDQRIAPLAKRLDELAAREPVAGPQGEPGEAGRDGRDGIDGAPGERGEKGEDGRDGADVVSALVDRDGNLVLTLSNGITKDVGRVVGRDGLDGKDGRDGIDGQAVAAVEDLPDDVCALVAKATRMLHERDALTFVTVAKAPEPTPPPVFNLTMPEITFPPVNVDVAAPDVRVPDVTVNVEAQPKRKTLTTVREHDDKGRIKSFEQQEIE